MSYANEEEALKQQLRYDPDHATTGGRFGAGVAEGTTCVWHVCASPQIAVLARDAARNLKCSMVICQKFVEKEIDPESAPALQTHIGYLRQVQGSILGVVRIMQICQARSTDEFCRAVAQLDRMVSCLAGDAEKVLNDSPEKREEWIRGATGVGIPRCIEVCQRISMASDILWLTAVPRMCLVSSQLVSTSCRR